ncbi:MAG TPA: MBL fold metallo-hydrolase [Anaerolineales bacterium]|nr:MBL fold metallo-hydrolase [Anaerolineales bacterium]
MKVTLLGTGTPTNPTRFQTGVIVEIGNDFLLFDAGRGTVHQMYQAGIEINRVNPVFITHHHFDHINDLFDVIISSAMRGRTQDLSIYGPTGTKRIVSALVEQVYAQDIRFRMEEDKGIRMRGGSWGEHPKAITKVNVRDVETGLIAGNERWKVYGEFVRHGEFQHAPDFKWYCMGYRIEAEGKVITISGDTVPCDGIVKLATGADLLIQCCHIKKSQVDNPLMEYLTESILPSSGQVGKIAAEACVKRMLLTHLSASITSKDFPEIKMDIEEHYHGEVLFGEDLLVVEI